MHQTICPTFDGDKDVEQCIEQAKIYLHQSGLMPEKEKVKLLLSNISGDARTIIKSYKKEELSSRKKMFNILKKEFKKRDKAYKKLHFLKQEVDEKSQVFLARIRGYGKDIGIKAHKKSEKFVLEYFLNGTRREIQKELKIRNIRSIRKAIKVAKEIEEVNNTRSKDKETAASFKQKSDDNKNNHKEENKIKDPKTSYQNRQETKKPFKGNCHFCHKYGHSYFFCRNSSDSDKERIREEQTKTKTKSINNTEKPAEIPKTFDSLNSKQMPSTSRMAQ